MEIRGKEVRIEGRVVRIAALDAEGYQYADDPEAMCRDLRESGKRVDLFTFIQRISETTPRYSYFLEWDNMAVLPVSTFDHWMKNQIDFKVRNKIRKAEKQGVIVREVPLDERLVQGIFAIYNETPIRQGRRFWHYGRDLESLRRTKAAYSDRSTFIGAFFKDNLIGFIKLTTDESGSQAGLMNIISMIQHRDKAPTNALIAQAVRSCADRNIPYLWYANMSYGRKQNSALADFKRHNGFIRVDLPRYYLPLTAVGRIALRVGLHRRAVDWIPEPIASSYRKIRNLWYTSRFAKPKNA